MPAATPRRRPNFAIESYLHQQSYALVAGSDEAGRGALCGPIVAAAVILDPANIPPGIDDSKRLSPKRRLSLFHYISETAQVGIGIADHHRIDRDNVLQASLWAMSEAVRQLHPLPDFVLIDGPFGLSRECRSQPIVGGDGLSLSIAAASIIAKVHRDSLMDELAATYHNYGFLRNKGYGTPEHLAALKEYGSTPIHRQSCGCVNAATAPSVLVP